MKNTYLAVCLVELLLCLVKHLFKNPLNLINLRPKLVLLSSLGLIKRVRDFVDMTLDATAPFAKLHSLGGYWQMLGRFELLALVAVKACR